MSLVQAYRLQLAAKQKRQLLIYLTLAVVIHAGVAVGLLWQAKQLLKPELKSAKPPIPLEFIDIAPTAKSTAPVQTERRAAVNSTAAGQRNPALSVQPGKATAPIAAAPPQPPQPAQPAPSQPPQQPAPRPVSPSRPSASIERIPPQPTPAPGVARTPPRSPQPGISATNPITKPTTNPTTNPAASPAATSPPATATQLGSPQIRSLAMGNSSSGGTSGSGISGQLNPNRNGSGTGVDAAQDNLWGGYLATLNRVVDQNWKRVAVAATRRTKVRFEVDRQGRLTRLELVEPSGDDLADQAAIQAVRTAAPFAPLPQNAPEDVLIVNFTFTQWLTPASP